MQRRVSRYTNYRASTGSGRSIRVVGVARLHLLVHAAARSSCNVNAGSHLAITQSLLLLLEVLQLDLDSQVAAGPFAGPV